MIRRLFILLSISFFALSCAKKDFLLIVVSDNLEVSREIQKSVPNNYEVQLQDPYELTDLNTSDILWIHDVRDSSAFDAAKIAEFVKRGGNLVLTSGAVMQLNYWGLESESVSEWQYDDVEFAQLPFYSHPIFENLSFESQLSQFDAREFAVFGFTGTAMPQMKDAAVLAVAYEDGKCRTDRKIMWEIPLIHGKILAAGAGFPFEESWASKRYLKTMTAGVLTYLQVSGQADSERKPHSGKWDCDTLLVQGVHAGHHVSCKICAAEYKPVKPQMPETIELPKGKKRHLAKEGELIELSEPGLSLKADEVAGISELWIDGVRIVNDYRPLADIHDIDSVVVLSDHIPYVESHKRGFTRTYNVDGVELTESVVLYPEHSSVVLHYQWSDSRVRQLFTEHRSDLAFDFPYDGTMMSLYFVWSLQLNATVVRSHDKNFCSIVGSNVPGRMTLIGRYDEISYADWRVRGTRTDKAQTASSVVYSVKGLNSMDVVISGTAKGVNPLLVDYAHTLRSPKEALNIGL